MSTALVPVDLKNYPVLAPGSDAAELLRQNLAGDSIGVGDLTRIKVPAGGAVTWSVPTIEGEQPEKVLEGVILHIGRRRAYWSGATPTGNPPDCSSSDCVIGVGTPGGPCDACPLNQYGTSRGDGGKPGRGKACKETRLVFLLRPGRHMPDVVSIPPGSLKTLRQYQLQLPVPFWCGLTRLKLVKAANKDGIGYAQVLPEFAGRLSDEQAAGVRKYADSLGSVFASATVEREEVDREE